SDSLFRREDRGIYSIRETTVPYEKQPRSARQELSFRTFSFGRAKLIEADCFEWLRRRDERSIHAVVTDPPYGLVEYSHAEQSKLRKGRGGVWRIPPSFDGCKRSPLPRFTTLTPRHLSELVEFFGDWGRCLRRVLVPGAHVFVASNTLVSYAVAKALVD